MTNIPMNELGTTHPAMIGRDIIRDLGDSVEIREVWDLKHPECPMVNVIYSGTKLIRYLRKSKEEMYPDD